MKQRANLLEAQIFGEADSKDPNARIWVRQRGVDGEAVIRAQGAPRTAAVSPRRPPMSMAGMAGSSARSEADSAQLLEGVWRFDNARILMPGEEPMEVQHYLLATNLSPQQVAKGAVSPDSVPFWDLERCAGRPRPRASIRQRSGCNFSRFSRDLCCLSRWC